MTQHPLTIGAPQMHGPRIDRFQLKKWTRTAEPLVGNGSIKNVMHASMLTHPKANLCSACHKFCFCFNGGLLAMFLWKVLLVFVTICAVAGCCNGCTQMATMVTSAILCMTAHAVGRLFLLFFSLLLQQCTRCLAPSITLIF